MEQINTVCDINNCTGCMACYNICKSGALTMHENNEGFFYPVINKSLCNGCNVCKKVCPINNVTNSNNQPLSVYSGWNKNDSIRLNSSSGGLFFEFANQILNDGGIVAGCIMSKNMTAEHSIINNKNDLYKLQGSKYVQSFIGDCYKQIKKHLISNKFVLFSGTPCQVDGLKRYLSKEYENLITIDLVCHGVPSPLIFEDYKKYIYEQKKIKATKIYFRDKQHSWPYFKIRIEDESSKKIYTGKYYEDPWIRGFLRNIYLRPSCSKCVYTRISRVADITLADWWGYKPYKNENKISPIKKGVSLLFINSNKGLDLLNKSKSNLILKKRTIEEALKTNKSLYKPYPASILRSNFWKDYKQLSFDIMIKKYMHPEKEISFHTKLLYNLPISIISIYLSKIATKIVRQFKKIQNFFLIKYTNFINNIYIKIETILLYKTIQKNTSKTIYIFSNPIHSNLGDQAQTYCIIKWLKSNYNNYKIICAPKLITPNKTIELIKNKLQNDDLIFIHSGYLIFDPHPELSYICSIVSKYKNKKITILPQTINLTNKEIINKVKLSFNNHKDLILMCRDHISYYNAKSLFPNSKLLLWPDFVTSLIGEFIYENKKRNGILFCLRNDGEKLYSEEEINTIKSSFIGIKVETNDTTILKSSYAWKFKRKKMLMKSINAFANYQLIITDRYHGTIFSQITSTPIIVISSTDHKLSSGVKWFDKEYFGQNVFFADNLDEINNIAINILQRNGEIIKNTSYFNDKYFSKLKHILATI